MKVIEWLRRIFRKKVTDEELNAEMERSRQKLEPKIVKTQDLTSEISKTQRKIATLNRSSREIGRSIRKQLKIEAIRRKNMERQRSTLGYGLRGKFKPRPAFEKKNWRLDKKPDDD